MRGEEGREGEQRVYAFTHSRHYTAFEYYASAKQKCWQFGLTETN